VNICIPNIGKIFCGIKKKMLLSFYKKVSPFSPSCRAFIEAPLKFLGEDFPTWVEAHKHLLAVTKNWVVNYC